ncbi:hypothetical protein J6590_105220 [Homalodisca vitripennis]|nr:hypothetical protein J6590_105220 [Homalodisca vitripennis]
MSLLRGEVIVKERRQTTIPYETKRYSDGFIGIRPVLSEGVCSTAYQTLISRQYQPLKLRVVFLYEICE